MPQTADNLLSDPEIATAYEDVRSDKSATTWMILKYISGTSDPLKLDSTGEGDIAEMVEHLGDDEAAYAFVRMTVGNDELSQRVKFVFVSWCGPNTRVMRRAKMTTQIGQVKQVLRSYAIEIQTDSKTDLKESEVSMKLRKAMGANYDRQTSGY
ncbi:actin depolymerizing protein [Aureobasidium subglaciale]|nr:actin depolymerizing protein [Aureobasidium subglaciale]